MLYLPESNLTFIHCQKTGGTFIYQALTHELKLPFEETKLSSHGSLPNIRKWKPDAQPFVFVRNPTEWFRSFWCDRMSQEEAGGDLPIGYRLVEGEKVKIEDFNEWATYVALNYPGYLSELYWRDTGYEDSGVWIGHTENLLDDLIGFLRKAGQPFNEELLRSLPHLNESATSLKEKAIYNPSTLFLVQEAEHLAYTRYGYEKVPYPEPLPFDEVFERCPGNGWLTREEAQLLWHVACKHLGAILEVGTYYGRSTVLLAGLNRVVYSVDPFVNFHSSIPGEEIQKQFHENLHHRGIENVYQFPQKIEHWHTRPIGFACLDGDHTYKGTMNQINIAIQCGATEFCLHDYADGGGGLQIKQAVEDSELNVIEREGRMAYCTL